MACNNNYPESTTHTIGHPLAHLFTYTSLKETYYTNIYIYTHSIVTYPFEDGALSMSHYCTLLTFVSHLCVFVSTLTSVVGPMFYTFRSLLTWVGITRRGTTTLHIWTGLLYVTWQVNQFTVILQTSKATNHSRIYRAVTDMFLNG